MLAKLHDQPFDAAAWVFEIKWDGYRAITEIGRKDIRLYSRNGLSFQPDYPAIYEELKKIKVQLILDGEIVALDEEGKPSFQLLQQYAKDPDVALCYYVFDCLAVKGKSIEDLPLMERKMILKELLPDSDVIKYCDHIEKRGKDFFKAIQEQGMEGIIAKRTDSKYAAGARTNDWLKIKNIIMEEAVIAGYTEARGGRKNFGALVLGIYKKEKLIYIGHTGTGFNDKALRYVYDKMQPLVTDQSPFDKKVPVNAPVTWVRPQLVCNLKYTQVTEGGNRRHPVFMGLRIDKAAKDVHEEVKDNAPETQTSKPEKVANKKAVAQGSKAPVKKVAVKAESSKNKTIDKPMTINGKKLAFTHLDKIYWPDEGYTKGDVVNYYNDIYKYIIPYLKDRPESLLRMPNGIAEKGFFHKDAGTEAPEWVESLPLWSDSAEKEIAYIICNDKPTLLYLANLGCIEINPWNSRKENLDNPDYLVMDIDPSENNSFEQVIETAQVIKQILDKAGALSFPKTSGATGIHVYVPLGAKYTYDQAKEFAHMIAILAQEQLPGFTSLERSLSKRGKDHIYIDFLQNRKGQTLSCAYSIRPKPGATVSAPLEWKEVKYGLHPSDFNIKNIIKRLDQKGDLFADVLKKAIDMKKCIEKLGG
jgi:bifunctional non-homologous end joining protein LigD